MNKEQLEKWIKEAQYATTSRKDYDASGNCWATVIYRHSGKLHSLSFLNRHPCEKWGEKGWIRGVYEPQEVVRKTKMVEEVYYEPKE